MDRDEIRRIAAETDEALEQRRAAWRRLKELAAELPKARAAAAARISAALAPDFSELARAYLVARLTRQADEIAAVAPMLALRDEIECRRIGLRTCVLSSAAHSAGDEFKKLRHEVVAALEAGVLARDDVPSAVRQAWRL